MNNLRKTLSVPLEIHWSTSLIPLLLIYKIGMIGVLYFIILTLSILVHEYAHAWAVISLKKRAHKIIIFGLGGACEMDPTIVLNKHENLKVSVMGPVASLVLGVMGCFLYFFFPNKLTSYFCFGNIIIGIFNLLPLYPCDGGRILYSLIPKLPPLSSMKVVLITSYVLSSIFIFLCLLFNLWALSIIFLFIMILAYKQYEGFKLIYHKFSSVPRFLT